VVFINTSFANNTDNTSQIGFVIVIADNSDSVNIVYWSSIKYKRVTHLILASKLYIITHRFNHSIVLKFIIKKIL
jgi:hypothetical protein